MDSLAERTRHRLGAVGLSARDASLKAGLSDGFIQNILTGKSASPRAENLHRLATVLGTTEAWLLREEGPETVAVTSDTKTLPRPTVRPADVPVPRMRDMPNDVPVLGTAAGSVEGSMIIGGIVDYVRRPPGLMNAKEVYAIYVDGTSMEPEHPHGELRFVNPHKPVRPGDSVVVQASKSAEGDFEGFIGRLVRQNQDRIVISKLNPENVLEFERPPAVAVHKVLTMNEMFGL